MQPYDLIIEQEIRCSDLNTCWLIRVALDKPFHFLVPCSADHFLNLVQTDTAL